VRDPQKQALIQDAEEMRDNYKVRSGFPVWLYFTVYTSS